MPLRRGRAVAALPRRLQTAAGPAGVGLRALRAATWAAALTLATLRVRGACFCAADYACLAAQRCALARRLCLAATTGLQGPCALKRGDALDRATALLMAACMASCRMALFCDGGVF